MKKYYSNQYENNTSNAQNNMQNVQENQQQDYQNMQQNLPMQPNQYSSIVEQNAKKLEEQDAKNYIQQMNNQLGMK